MIDRAYAIFRQVDGGPQWGDGLHWQAELHDPDANSMGLLYPVALAWITDYGIDSPVGGPSIDFVLVPDPFRRRGYATRLVVACEERFPGLWLTEAISPEGEALIDALERIDAMRPPP